jgi:hypothetical protein
MSVKLPDGWVGLTAVVRRSVADHREFVAGLMAFYEELGAKPRRMTYHPPKVGVYVVTPKRMKAFAEELRAKFLVIGSHDQDRDQGVAGDGQFYIKDDENDPAGAEFERRWSGAFAHSSLNITAFRTLARLLEERFGLISAGMMFQVRRADVGREALMATGDRDDCTPGVVERTDWDAGKWRKSHTALRRLYPVTIIGPEIWSRLPPMPVFDPMPTIEDFGDCKLMTAWPTLCSPRDPDFLRGTRALREWLWPYTIQNPADHIDNDPSA